MVNEVTEALIGTYRGVAFHPPGRVFTDPTVAVAGGADAISGISVLGDREDLFGPVVSMPSTWWVLDRVDADRLPGVRDAKSAARASWAAGAGWNRAVSRTLPTLDKDGLARLLASGGVGIVLATHERQARQARDATRAFHGRDGYRTTRNIESMRTIDPTGTRARLHTAPRRAGDRLLATRLATAPGLVRAGASHWDDGRTPLKPLSLESAYADPVLLRDLGARGARFARELGVDVVVGAETAGVPLAASVSLAAALPFAFVRKPGYRGHEIDEPPVRGADVAGRRVLLVDDGIWRGTSLERFTAALVDEGADVVGAFFLVDMREVAEKVTSLATSLRTDSVSTYLEVLDLATANGLLDPAVHQLSVDAIVNRWTDDDPRWDLLPVAS